MKPKCFNDCDAPVVTTIEGQPVCDDCAAHYLREKQAVRMDYTDSATAYDMRFGSSNDFND